VIVPRELLDCLHQAKRLRFFFTREQLAHTRSIDLVGFFGGISVAL
jgi:hypothetical protein